MLMIVLMGFVLNVTWGAARGVLGYATEMSTTSLLQETNIQRSQNGQSALTVSNLLSKAAQAKADDMVARDYWSHNTPDGKEPWQFISNAGYSYFSAGENLAYGFDTSASAVAGWMNSETHRTNLLNSDYTEVGFGIANSSSYQNNGEETIVVAMYAKPQPVAATNPAQTQNTLPAAVHQEQTSSNKPVASNLAPKTVVLQSKEVSRVDLVTNGSAQWAALTVSLLAILALAVFTYKHAKLWHRYLVKGETFFIKHPLFDIVLIAVNVVGVLLTQTSGFIR